MNTKLMKIDLSAFFEDERKSAYILVDPKWESVECLQRRVELLFGVDSVRFLCDGYFLPPQEPIEILQFCDNIKAFVSKESLEIKKKKSKKCKNFEDSSENAEHGDNQILQCDKQQVKTLKKKRKSCFLQTSNSIGDSPCTCKRAKNSHTNAEIQLPSDDDNRIDIEMDKSAGIPKEVSEYEIFEEDKSYKLKSQKSRDSDYQQKQHRTSTIKEKSTPEIGGNELGKTLNHETKRSERPSSIHFHDVHHSSISLNPNNPFKNSKSIGSHIYFNENDAILNSTPKRKSDTISKKEKKSTTNVIFRCPLIDVTNGTESQKPRIFNLKPKDGINITTKQIVEIQEDIILPPLTNGEYSTSDVHDNKQTADSTESKDSSNEKNSLNNVTIATGSATICKNDKEDETCAKDSEVSRNLKLNTSETLNESQIDITGIRDVTETQTECEIFHTDGDDTEAPSTSQIDLTNIDVNATETENKSQLYVDENFTEIQNVSPKEKTNVHSHLENNTQVEQCNNNEISTILIDCVDLSNDLDEVSKLDDSVQEKHDLTADNANNKSSTSCIEEISDIIDLNETEDNCKGNISSKRNKLTKKLTIKDILASSVDITSLPQPEDIIVFKVPYTKNDKTVANTDFIAGKVQYINRRTRSLNIMIIDGFSEMRYVPSRFFHRNKKVSQDLMTYFQISLTDMREEKLYSTS